MRYTARIITRINALTLALLLAFAAGAAASEMDDNLTVGIVSVRTQALNPLLTLERDFQAATGLIYESLVTLDESYDPAPCLAESWETTDYTNWVFTIRSNVTFHDGTPLTAYDIEATLNEILRLANDDTAENKGAYSSIKYLIKKVSANNATTLALQSTRAYYGFLYALTFPVLKADEVAAVNPVGSGPYRVEIFQPGDYLYLSANENWWQKPPSVKEINISFHTTSKELTASFEYNRVDTIITRSVTAAQYRAGVSSVNLNYTTRQLETLLFNNQVTELKDVRVRKAIRYAINKDALISGAYYGMASKTNTPFPMDSWMYYDSTTEDGESVYAYNPEKARQLLKEAGWEDSDGDGVLDTVVNGKKANLKLRFYVYEESDNSVRVQTANSISDMLKAVGINAPVTTVSFSDAKAKLKAGSFDLALAAFQMDAVPDPGFMLISPNNGNYGRYKSTEMNDLFKSLRKAQDKAGCLNYLRSIQDLFGRDCPFLCLYYRDGAILSRKVFTNVHEIREPNLLNGVETIGN